MPKANHVARAAATALATACPDCDKLDSMSAMDWANFFKALMDFLTGVLPIVLPIFMAPKDTGPPSK